MSHALSIAVIQGGPSVEAEVSRSSAKSVRQALAEGGHRVATLELDRFLSESLRSGGFDVAFPVTHGAVGEDGSLQGLLEVIEIPYVGSGVLATAMAMDKGVARIQFAHAGLPYTRSHLLRHSMANRLLAGGASLKEVADVLRHRSLNTTMIYAKLDSRNLAEVALAWPGSAA